VKQTTLLIKKPQKKSISRNGLFFHDEEAKIIFCKKKELNLRGKTRQGRPLFLKTPA
jgi:hypothetical protein